MEGHELIMCVAWLYNTDDKLEAIVVIREGHVEGLREGLFVLRCLIE